MLRARVSAAHMGGYLGPKFSEQGSLFRQIFLKHGLLSRNWKKLSKVGSFPPTFIIIVGMTATVCN